MFSFILPHLTTFFPSMAFDYAFPQIFMFSLSFCYLISIHFAKLHVILQFPLARVSAGFISFGGFLQN